MLDSIVIDNFRLFKHLELTRLGRVNLIVGKNHSGKSTLLEAVRLFASDADPEVLIDLVGSRQELQVGNSLRNLRSNGRGHAYRHLFYGHELPKFTEDGIRLGPTEAPDRQIHIRPAAYHRVNEGGVIGQRRLDQVDSSDLPEDPTAFDVFMVVETSSGTRRLINLDTDPRHMLRRTILTRKKETSPPVLLVAAQSTNLDELASYWDATSLTDLEKDVVVGLQLIEPGITGIAFVDNKIGSGVSRRIPMIKLIGMKEPLPLKTMGDGILRLFHIVLTLVNAQGGVLLVDEMENGIHWSVQPRVWDLAFQLAERLDVQVFATTHSKDCVRGFEAAWREHPEQGAFFRLEASNEAIVSTRYNCETLADSLEMAVEIR